MAALEKLLKHFSREGDEVFITGANLHVRNGLGETACGSQIDPEPNCANGRGNLIVGYNELREESGQNVRTGSHNVVVGPHHHYTRSAGLVVGDQNDLLGDFSTVIGYASRADGATSAVLGGQSNAAIGRWSTVAGGGGNRVEGLLASDIPHRAFHFCEYSAIQSLR